MSLPNHPLIDANAITPETITQQLVNDHKVKVAGIDGDGVLRGKIMSQEKFLASLKGGFGMSSAIFAWDMHDVLYAEEGAISSEKDGYGDFIAEVDLSSFRRLPFEDNIPFFMLKFKLNGVPVFADGRSLIQSTTEDMAKSGMRGLAGVELEFTNFQTPSQDGYGPSAGRPNLAGFLNTNSPGALRPLTGGMFGYSLSRPLMTKEYFHSIYDKANELGCSIEGWHTESGPGVYEAALAVSSVDQMADNVSVFKFLAKALGVEHGVTPCFMAKPIGGLPGNSGHIHVSLNDLKGKNLFARESKDDQAPWADAAHLSDIGQQFLAGLIDALPDIMPLFAPNINSYKRLVENFWAPVTVSWGLEDRVASIRLIAPPTCKPVATRFEIRIPGADVHPHYALTAIFRAGFRGIQRKMKIELPPLSQLSKGQEPAKLPNTLEKAVERFQAQDSVARIIMGNEFVDFYTGSRRHELAVWREAVTDCPFPLPEPLSLNQYISSTRRCSKPPNFNLMMEPRFKQEIQQMMYVAGETQDVSTNTIKLIEDIIRDQVVHILGTANDLAARRGSRVMSNNDIIFQLRHDVARTERIRTFLTWKAIRKTVKDSEDKEGLVDEADLDDDAVANPADDAPANRVKFPTVSFPWDISSFFADHVAHISPDDLTDITSSEAALEKLRRNDERTRDMTVAEYATWSEYRHASLTYRKAKRFREWCGLGVIADNKLNDDVMDILGFLTSEMVQNLTAEALSVQGEELVRTGRGAATGSDTVQTGNRGLFADPEGVRRAIGEKHVRMAFHRLQKRPNKGRAFLSGARSSPSLSLL